MGMSNAGIQDPHPCQTGGQKKGGRSRLGESDLLGVEPALKLPRTIGYEHRLAEVVALAQHNVASAIPPAVALDPVERLSCVLVDDLE